MSRIYDGISLEPVDADVDVHAEPDDDAGLDPVPVMDGVARLLELAVQNADELLAEANTEAEQIKARAQGDQLLEETRDEAEQVKAVAGAEADQLLAEARDQAGQAKALARSEAD